MQYTVLLTMALSGLAIATPIEKRQTSGPCFHAGSAAVCCPDTTTQVFATDCKTRKLYLNHPSRSLADRSTQLEIRPPLKSSERHAHR